MSVRWSSPPSRPSAAQPNPTPGSPSPAAVFIARQPIFDRLRNVYAYELLFRDTRDARLEEQNPDRASLKVIEQAFLHFGVEVLTRGKPAFVRFTRDTLLRDYATLLTSSILVVQLSPGVEMDPEVLDRCRQLKQSGYALAIDSGALGRLADPAVEQLVGLADFVRVDFPSLDATQREAVGRALGSLRVRAIADRVEAQGDFQQALKFGYAYVQGPFISQPVVLSTNRVPASKVNYLELLREVNRAEVDLSKIEAIVKREVSLSFKLLRYLNSAAVGLSHQVTSIRHALLLLGETGVKKWATLVIFANIGIDQPSELVLSSVLRARVCEALARRIELAHREQDLFLLGLFSMIDVIVGVPLPALLAGLPLAGDVRAALQGSPGRLRDTLDLAIACEGGDWDAVARGAARLGVPEPVLAELFSACLGWAHAALSEDFG